jgi:hypothetical protein
MPDRLYKVSVEFTYYVLAESERHAESFVNDVVLNEDLYGCTDATEVTSRTYLDCTGDYLVYGPAKDVTIDDALESVGLPSVSNFKKAQTERLLSATTPTHRP